MSGNFSRVHYQIMWNRLISVVEEQALTLGAHGLLHLCPGIR